MDDEKLAKARALRDQGLSYREIARAVDIGSGETVRRWLVPGEREKHRLRSLRYAERNREAIRESNRKSSRRYYDRNRRTEQVKARERQRKKRDDARQNGLCPCGRRATDGSRCRGHAAHNRALAAYKRHHDVPPGFVIDHTFPVSLAIRHDLFDTIEDERNMRVVSRAENARKGSAFHREHWLSLPSDLREITQGLVQQPQRTGDSR